MKREQNNPSYYANIPATVRYDKELTANEKLMYGEITALASVKGRAWASNNYFAELYNVHKNSVSRWISNLEKRGFIKVELEYKHNSKQVSKRYIYINDTPILNNVDTPINNNVDRYKQNCLEGINNNVKEVLNNTSTNITSINKESSSNSKKPEYGNDSPYIKLAKHLFNYLKKRNPKHRVPNWQRWADDFRKTVELDKRTVKEVKDVIDWSQQDDFWQNNILSAGKLRQQFDQLYLKMNEDNSHKAERDWSTWEF